MTSPLEKPAGFKDQEQRERADVYGRDTIALNPHPLPILGIDGAALDNDDEAVEDPALGGQR
jgi:hypothetical protein